MHRPSPVIESVPVTFALAHPALDSHPNFVCHSDYQKLAVIFCALVRVSETVVISFVDSMGLENMTRLEGEWEGAQPMTEVL